MVTVVLADEGDGTNDDAPILVRPSQITASVRTAVAPLAEQVRGLTARRAPPDPDMFETDLDQDELGQLICDTLRNELTTVVGREVKAAINALRGRID